MAYSTHKHTMLYFTLLASVFAILASSKVTQSSYFVLPSVCHVTVNSAVYSSFLSISVCHEFLVAFCI